jgi:hypothetical protein
MGARVVSERDREIDAIIRTAEALDRALDRLDRDSLRMLADRLEVPNYRPTRELRRTLRRHLIGLVQ